MSKKNIQFKKDMQQIQNTNILIDQGIGKKILKNKNYKTKINFIFYFLFILSISSPFFTSKKLYCACSNCTNSSGTCSSCTPSIDCCLGKCDGYPYLQMRSQGRDTSRQFAGLEQFIYKNDKNLTYGTFAFTLEYDQAINRKKLTHFLFGSDLVDCCQLYIQGSQVQNRNQKAWLADYFGLPEDFSSKVKFCPNIQNVVMDLNFYIGLDELAKGLFLEIDAPFAWTKWTLDQCEQLISTGTTGYEAGYMASNAIAATSLSNSFLQVMQGGYTFGDMKIPMRFGKITNCDCSAYGFAQMDFSLGYNFILRNNGHFGALIYGSAPTGTRPCSSKLFEPVLGNGKHWEFGLGLIGSYIFYRNREDEEKFAGIYFDTVIGHLFKTNQMRSFDLCSKPNSRYMLLEEITDADKNLTGSTPLYTQSTYQYAKTLIPAINWFTFNIKNQINIQADLSVKLAYTNDNFNFDLGYNFWARSGERFSNLAVCACDTSKTYAIKGDSMIYGQYTDGIQTPTVVQMGQTQTCATIHGPSNCTLKPGQIDNGQLAFYTTGSTHNIITNVGQTGAQNQLYTSIQPIAAARSMLNTGDGPAGITHKLFGNIEYAWKEHKNNTPFVCVGGKIEFSQDRYKDCCCNKNCSNNSCCQNSTSQNYCSCLGSNNSTNNSNCATCCTQDCNTSLCSQIQTCGNCTSFKHYEAPRVALGQWGFWVKGGVAFN